MKFDSYGHVALDKMLIEQGNNPGMFGAIQLLYSKKRPCCREYSVI